MGTPTQRYDPYEDMFKKKKTAPAADWNPLNALVALLGNAGSFVDTLPQKLQGRSNYPDWMPSVIPWLGSGAGYGLEQLGGLGTGALGVLGSAFETVGDQRKRLEQAKKTQEKAEKGAKVPAYEWVSVFDSPQGRTDTATASLQGVTPPPMQGGINPLAGLMGGGGQAQGWPAPQETPPVDWNEINQLLAQAAPRKRDIAAEYPQLPQLQAPAQLDPAVIEAFKQALAGASPTAPEAPSKWDKFAALMQGAAAGSARGGGFSRELAGAGAGALAGVIGEGKEYKELKRRYNEALQQYNASKAQAELSLARLVQGDKQALVNYNNANAEMEHIRKQDIFKLGLSQEQEERGYAQYHAGMQMQQKLTDKQIETQNKEAAYKDAKDKVLFENSQELNRFGMLTDFYRVMGSRGTGTEARMDEMKALMTIANAKNTPPAVSQMLISKIFLGIAAETPGPQGAEEAKNILAASIAASPVPFFDPDDVNTIEQEIRDAGIKQGVTPGGTDWQNFRQEQMTARILEVFNTEDKTTLDHYLYKLEERAQMGDIAAQMFLTYWKLQPVGKK